MYFDSEDYSNPVKINVNADLSYYTLKGVTKSIDVRIRKKWNNWSEKSLLLCS